MIRKEKKSFAVEDNEVNTVAVDVPPEEDDQPSEPVQDNGFHLPPDAMLVDSEYDPWDGTYSLFPVAEHKQWDWIGAETSMLTSMYRKALVDCGASATVCGYEWIKSWRPSFQLSDLSQSVKKFRFGDGHGCQSLGYIVLQASAQGRITGKWIPMGIQTDVVK